jgi:hypothetical protein
VRPTWPLGLLTAAVLGALVGAFVATPYPSLDEPRGPGDAGFTCCPFGPGPWQRGMLHLPDTMQHGESYLVVLVADPKASPDSMRVMGEELLGEPASWDTVQVPLTDRLVVRAAGQRFKITPVRPEERKGLVREHSGPTMWAWEIEPLYPGRLRFFIGGSAWPDRASPPERMGLFLRDNIGDYFDVAQRRIEVRESWGRRLEMIFSNPAVQWIGYTGIATILLWVGRAGNSLRHRRAAGFGQV